MKNLRIRAIITGVLTDVLGGIASVFILAVIMFLVTSHGRALQSEVLSQRFHQISSSIEFMLLSLIIGTLIDFLSGLITGLVAKTAEIRHAWFVGIISLSIALGLSLSHQGEAQPQGRRAAADCFPAAAAQPVGPGLARTGRSQP